MARLSTYAKDKIPELGDKVIGSNAGGALETLNYTLRDIGELFNLKNVVGVADQSIFLFQNDIQNGREPGTLSFAEGGGDGTLFSGVTTFLLSKSAAGLGSRDKYLPLFVGKDIILAELGNINNFGTFLVTSIVEDVAEADFFVVSVTNTHSNGAIALDKPYIFSEFQNPDSDAGDLNFTHTQTVASSSWNIVHNLGKHPSVSIADSGGNWVIGNVSYTNMNELNINFTAAFSGRAYLN